MLKILLLIASFRFLAFISSFPGRFSKNLNSRYFCTNLPSIFVHNFCYKIPPDRCNEKAQIFTDRSALACLPKAGRVVQGCRHRPLPRSGQQCWTALRQRPSSGGKRRGDAVSQAAFPQRDATGRANRGDKRSALLTKSRAQGALAWNVLLGRHSGQARSDRPHARPATWRWKLARMGDMA